MHPAWLLAFATLLAAGPALAEDPELPADETPDYSCDQKGLAEEIRTLCDGLAASLAGVMASPADIPGSGRVAPGSSLVRRPITTQIIGSGLAPVPANAVINPFAAPVDNALGVRVSSTQAPVQFQTQMIQPGLSGETWMNWELKAEHAPEASGFYYGGATGGTANAAGTTESLSTFLGVRTVATPADNVRIGTEFAPRFGIADLGAPQGWMSLDPKITASSDFGRLGTSDFTGSIKADAGYRLPLEGDPTAWGGFRFSVKPR